MNTLMRALVLTMAVGCGAASLTACAGSQPQDEAALALKRSMDQRIQTLKTVTSTLRQSPFAPEAAAGLDQADVWLGRIEAIMARPRKERDKDQLELLLQATEGQLIEVRAFFSRREAETDLESKRSTYQNQMEEIEALREQNQRALGDAKGGEE